MQHLVHAKDNVKLTIISDNKLKLLKLSEYNDFLAEYPKKAVDFIRSQDRAHDRYIVIDNGTATMKVYHCGASSKDAGKRITTITRLIDINDQFCFMNEGLPCIAFDSAEGAREIINSGENGYLIKHRNLDAMVKKIEDLIKDKEERIKIGAQARESVKKFTSDVVSEEWITLIEESDIYD